MSNSPSLAAIKLFKAWSYNKLPEEIFPVSCKRIAEELKIKVVFEDIGNDFEGMLYVKNNKKIILCNKNIVNTGRINFTIGHELGHYCLHKDRQKIKCSLEDLIEFNESNNSLEKKIEREANVFAANLLMPAHDIRTMIKGKLLNIKLIKKLSNKYLTSWLAVACRVIDIYSKAACLLVLKNNKVLWHIRSHTFDSKIINLQYGRHIDLEDYDINDDGCITNLQFIDENATQDYEVTLSGFSIPSLNQKIILLVEY